MCGRLHVHNVPATLLAHMALGAGDLDSDFVSLGLAWSLFSVLTSADQAINTTQISSISVCVLAGGAMADTYTNGEYTVAFNKGEQLTRNEHPPPTLPASTLRAQVQLAGCSEEGARVPYPGGWGR